MEDILSKISGFITADNIALLSVIITVLIFVASRHEELKYKKHDDKKVQYLKLINLMEETFMGTKKDKNNFLIQVLLFYYMDQRKYIVNTCYFVNLRIIL